MSQFNRAVQTQPPAKLNLFLELLEKRQDGFHEIDTVMIPIDLRDELWVGRIPDDEIRLKVRWLPSLEIVAQRLGVDLSDEQTAQLLYIPENATNLVSRALSDFKNRFDVKGGFACNLGKRIPAGAGMGGASSDAASALLCAAELCGVPANSTELLEIAASIGSDVPFFMGDPLSMGDVGQPIQAARALGRGERINPIDVQSPLEFVVVYPNQSLSTAKVYAGSVVPPQPFSAEPLISALSNGKLVELQGQLFNRLAEPAKEILPRIDEILKSLWRSGMPACQLTGSGSACYAIADSIVHGQISASRLQSVLEPGAFVTQASSVTVPACVLPAEF